jgi:SPASM domain peptide maturase of grasp-with-spasm system
MLEEKYIVFFECCFITTGKSRSIIVDTQRSKIEFIPNSLAERIKNGSISKADFFKHQTKEELDILQEYYEFLIENEYAFVCDKPFVKYFSKIKLEWDFPSKITNAIIDITTLNKSSLKSLKELEKLHCYHIQMRFYVKTTLLEFTSLLNELKTYSFETVEFIMPCDELISNEIKALVIAFPFVISIIFSDALITKVEQQQPYNNGSIGYTTQKINNCNSCGNISPEYFTTEIENFTESQKYNTCLNRKISIDVNGDIKNCPSMKESFGNIQDTSLEQALNKKRFKKLWNVNKDKIKVCQDCEFRHICTDCRAYREDPEDIYSKPLKCGYSPYTNEWEEWSTNPLKQKTIGHYGMQEQVKNEIQGV